MQVGEWVTSVLEREEVVRQVKRRKGKEKRAFYLLCCHGERERRGKEERKEGD